MGTVARRGVRQAPTTAYRCTAAGIGVHSNRSMIIGRSYSLGTRENELFGLLVHVPAALLLRTAGVAPFYGGDAQWVPVASSRRGPGASDPWSWTAPAPRDHRNISTRDAAPAKCYRRFPGPAGLRVPRSAMEAS